MEVCLSQNFMVSAVLKVLRKLLSGTAYSAIVKETVALMVNRQDKVDCFDAFADMLLSLMAG